MYLIVKLNFWTIDFIRHSGVILQCVNFGQVLMKSVLTKEVGNLSTPSPLRHRLGVFRCHRVTTVSLARTRAVHLGILRVARTRAVPQHLRWDLRLTRTREVLPSFQPTRGNIVVIRGVQSTAGDHPEGLLLASPHHRRKQERKDPRRSRQQKLLWNRVSLFIFFLFFIVSYCW